MNYKNIMEIVPTMEAVRLVDYNIKAAKKPKKNMMDIGFTNIVGISLIKAESDMIASL